MGAEVGKAVSGHKGLSAGRVGGGLGGQLCSIFAGIDGRQ